MKVELIGIGRYGFVWSPFVGETGGWSRDEEEKGIEHVVTTVKGVGVCAFRLRMSDCSTLSCTHHATEDEAARSFEAVA